MADEILYIHPESGVTNLYFLMHKGNKVVNGSTGALLDRSADNWTSAVIPLSDSLLPRHYTGTVPRQTPPGVYTIVVYSRSGASPASTDVPFSSIERFDWDGSKITDTNNIDGLTPDAVLELLMSVISGVSVVSNDDTVTFMKRDGSTGKIRVTFDLHGNRSASVIL